MVLGAHCSGERGSLGGNGGNRWQSLDNSIACVPVLVFVFDCAFILHCCIGCVPVLIFAFDFAFKDSIALNFK